MASIKQLDERRYKITVSNGYRPNGKKISKAKTIQVPPGVPKRGIGHAVAVQNLLGHAVKLGYKSVRFNALEIFKHLVLVIALAGLRPRLVDNFFKQFFQLGKSFLGIRCAYIDFHI